MVLVLVMATVVIVVVMVTLPVVTAAGVAAAPAASDSAVAAIVPAPFTATHFLSGSKGGPRVCTPGPRSGEVPRRKISCAIFSTSQAGKRVRHATRNARLVHSLDAELRLRSYGDLSQQCDRDLHQEFIVSTDAERYLDVTPLPDHKPEMIPLDSCHISQG